jgi:hypothetical protein
MCSELFNFTEMADRMFVRLLLNMLSLFILVRYIYYPYNGGRRYYFSFFLIGLMVFFIASILELVNFEMGFALGLFAIFSIIRYRTPSVEIKDMTYLFLVIGIAIINALVEFFVLWRGIIVTNFIILMTTYLMERYQPGKKVTKKQLTFNPSHMSVVVEDNKLKEEIEIFLNKPLLKIEVEKMNASKNEVVVQIFYHSSEKAKSTPQVKYR